MQPPAPATCCTPSADPTTPGDVGTDGNSVWHRPTTTNVPPVERSSWRPWHAETSGSTALRVHCRPQTTHTGDDAHDGRPCATLDEHDRRRGSLERRHGLYVRRSDTEVAHSGRLRRDDEDFLVEHRDARSGAVDRDDARRHDRLRGRGTRSTGCAETPMADTSPRSSGRTRSPTGARLRAQSRTTPSIVSRARRSRSHRSRGPVRAAAIRPACRRPHVHGHRRRRGQRRRDERVRNLDQRRRLRRLPRVLGRRIRVVYGDMRGPRQPARHERAPVTRHHDGRTALERRARTPGQRSPTGTATASSL